LSKILAIPQDEPVCPIHGFRLISTYPSPIGADAILTCPACSAEILDRLAALPGVITINITKVYVSGQERPDIEKELEARREQLLKEARAH
jgi:hypothetical protein